MVTSEGALNGGHAFGAVVDAMASTVARPPVWATAQFVAHARLGDELEIGIEVVVQGHRTTQARATLRRGAAEVCTVVGAFGSREGSLPPISEPPPPFPEPEACEPHPRRGESILDRLDVRTAGKQAIWARLPPGRTVPTPGDLAVVGDLTMLALSDALGVPSTGNSLDNTLRYANPCPTTWILVASHVDLVARGYASVRASLWNERGEPLAVASQTLVVRPTDTHGRARRTTKRFA